MFNKYWKTSLHHVIPLKRKILKMNFHITESFSQNNYNFPSELATINFMKNFLAHFHIFSGKIGKLYLLESLKLYLLGSCWLKLCFESYLPTATKYNKLIIIFTNVEMKLYMNLINTKHFIKYETDKQ